MAYASLSPEGQIENGLRSIECSQRQFSDIACAMGHPVSSALISLCLSGKRAFSPWTAERLRQGIYHGATFMEAQLCEREDVAVVGGGNSAGQAAVFLSQTARKVYMLVRSGKLSDTMSRYLIQRIEENPAIELHYKTEIVGLAGDAHLERISWQDKVSGETLDHEIRHVFIMAGASPRTEWLMECLALDNKGFILTGRDLDGKTGEVGVVRSTSSLHA
jgi:thioredoxin reductase